MIVTEIEPYTKTKFRVFLDWKFAFVLYKGELSRFGIRKGTEIPQETFYKIKNEVVLRRAKLRAIHLLTDMDRTESGLREKLRGSLYPEDVVDEAVEYVKSYGYINDSRYAENFVLSKKDSKSRMEIRSMLSRKGIGEDEIDSAMELYDGEGQEEEAVRRILVKKKFDFETCDEVQMKKIYGYLSRRGFRYDTIRQVIQNCNQDA